jgi:hypothetical protein
VWKLYKDAFPRAALFYDGTAVVAIKVWSVFGYGNSAGAAAGDSPPGYGSMTLASGDRRFCACHFAPGMSSGFRACRCTTRCTLPAPVHPETGWLKMLWDSTHPVGFKSELLPATTMLDITPQTELTRDLFITFPAMSATSQNISPADWREKLFPPHRDVANVHPTHPIMPLVIELIDYTSSAALDLSIVTENRVGKIVHWTPRAGTCLIDGDRSESWRATEGVFLPPQPAGGAARRVLYVYDVEECARPSIRACLAINFQQLQTDIKFASRTDSAVSLIPMPPTMSPKPIRDAKQLFALCVAREIVRAATKPVMEVSTLVREADQSQGAPHIVLPHYFKTAPEVRRPGVTDDLMELLETWRDRAGHARRCFDASSRLTITAAQLGAGGATKPVTLHLRFTYVTVPHMTSVEPLTAAAAAAAAVTTIT